MDYHIDLKSQNKVKAYIDSLSNEDIFERLENNSLEFDLNIDYFNVNRSIQEIDNYNTVISDDNQIRKVLIIAD